MTKTLKCGHLFTEGKGEGRCGLCDRCWGCCSCPHKMKTLSSLPISSRVVRTNWEGEGQYKAYQNYRKWWVGKYCRQGNREFRLVADVRLYGAPSFIYGGASFVYEDGTEQIIMTHAYRPRKYDVEVLDEHKG